MHFRKMLVMMSLISLPVCTTIPENYYLKITPATDTKVAQMRINDTVRFQVSGMQENKEDNTKIEVSVDKAWWDFNKEILQRTVGDKASITLKAIKPGASELKCTAMIDNRNVESSITILIREETKAK